ncbi:MAG: alanine racemase [Firmicutes bacterium]|nr:alanine racemase [Bacillota bacterium]
MRYILQYCHPAWIEINLDNILHNLEEVKKLAGKETKILAMVKADAYGHGAVNNGCAVLAGGADYLGVAILDEALELRNAGIKAPVLVMGTGIPGQADVILKNGITQTVCSIEMAEALSRAASKNGKKALIHIKVDTGMGRIGFFPKEAPSAIKKIKKLPNLVIEGIFSHFATAPDEDKRYVNVQHDKFVNLLKELDASRLSCGTVHISNSATIIDMPFMKHHMIRPGIMLYGLYPSEHMKLKIDLKPALSLKAKISFVKKTDEKSSISYGRTYFASKNEIIATIPVGYADGYNRKLSNNFHVLINGQFAPIVGRVCMDQFMVNVSAIKGVTTGDEAVLIGKQGDKVISIDEMAKAAGTINYELVCLMSRRIPRIYLEKGKAESARTLNGTKK